MKRVLLAPIDSASLVAFRVGVGLMLAFAMIRFWARGWIHEELLAPRFHFTYPGFSWVRPLPGHGMYVVFGAMVVCALLVAFGRLYRWAVASLCVLFTYAHLIDATYYLNHYYLLSLVLLLMSFLPLDRIGRDVQARAWMCWLLRFQFGVVYVFAGLAKVQEDWLVHAQPLTVWLANMRDTPIVGAMLSTKPAAYAMSWLGAGFDLAVVPLLLMRATRTYAFAVLVIFHLATAHLFRLGMFPWIMTFGALLFFDPSWPRKLVRARWLGAASIEEPTPARVHAGLLYAYAAFQIALPLRHFAYGGNVLWHESGIRFAWHVMIAEKNGVAELQLVDPVTGARTSVAASDELTALQCKAMATQPDLLITYARHLAEEHTRTHGRRPRVHGTLRVSLNGRAGASLIDETVDLASVTDGLGPRRFVVPFDDVPPLL